jgi:thymidine kinase
MDFLGRPFGPMPFLMATAEYVTKVHAICKKTGNLANYSMRISKNQDLVQLGETDSYEAVSRRVFVDDVLNKKE